jgi:hypothetical protein
VLQRYLWQKEVILLLTSPHVKIVDAHFPEHLEHMKGS